MFFGRFYLWSLLCFLLLVLNTFEGLYYGREHLKKKHLKIFQKFLMLKKKCKKMHKKMHKNDLRIKKSNIIYEYL